MASSTGGRFLPGDPRVSEPYRLTPQLAFRVAVLAFLTLGVFAVLFLRLWALQVLSGNTYLTQANDNRVRTLRIEAPRGLILDNTGKVLVTNVAGTRVELWPADLPKKWPTERNELRALSNVTGVSVATMLDEPREEQGRSGDADRRPARAQAEPDPLPRGESGAVPRRPPPADASSPVPVPVARGAGPRLRRRDLAGGVRDAEEEGLPAERPDRPDGHRVRLRHLPPRQGRHGAADGRLRSAGRREPSCR